MTTEQIDKDREEVQRMIRNGWVFVYEPDTQYIGADHVNGIGKRSICKMGSNLFSTEIDAIANVITSDLNGINRLSDTEKSLADGLLRKALDASHLQGMKAGGDIVLENLSRAIEASCYETFTKNHIDIILASAKGSMMDAFRESKKEGKN